MDRLPYWRDPNVVVGGEGVGLPNDFLNNAGGDYWAPNRQRFYQNERTPGRIGRAERIAAAAGISYVGSQLYRNMKSSWKTLSGPWSNPKKVPAGSRRKTLKQLRDEAWARRVKRRQFITGALEHSKRQKMDKKRAIDNTAGEVAAAGKYLRGPPAIVTPESVNMQITDNGQIVPLTLMDELDVARHSPQLNKMPKVFFTRNATDKKKIRGGRGLRGQKTNKLSRFLRLFCNPTHLNIRSMVFMASTDGDKHSQTWQVFQPSSINYSTFGTGTDRMGTAGFINGTDPALVTRLIELPITYAAQSSLADSSTQQASNNNVGYYPFAALGLSLGQAASNVTGTAINNLSLNRMCELIRGNYYFRFSNHSPREVEVEFYIYGLKQKMDTSTPDATQMGFFNPLQTWINAVDQERANKPFLESGGGNLVCDPINGYGEVPIGPCTFAQTPPAEVVYLPVTTAARDSRYVVFGRDRPEKHKEFNKHFYVAKKVVMKLAQGSERYFVFRLRRQVISEEKCREAYLPSLDYAFMCFARGQLGVVNEAATNNAGNIGRTDFDFNIEVQRQFTVRVASESPNRPRVHNLIQSGFVFNPPVIGTDSVLAVDPQTGALEAGGKDPGNV